VIIRILQLSLSGVLALMLGTNVARAADSDYNLKITGTIVAQTCDVTSQSQNQTVNIGDFSTPEFPSTGSTGAEKPFKIDLTGCTPGIAGAKVMFSGAADATNPDLLALSDTSGGGEMATGVGVEILDGSKNTIAINNTDSGLFSLQEGSNSLQFYLRYKSTTDTVTAGNATAVMYFDLQYQ
jgi:type 1 fimbria pilin